MTEAEIDRIVLAHIEDQTRQGLGMRTTWTHDIAPLVDGATDRDISASIRRLVEAKRLKCVTEEWHDYCWLVPFTWEDKPVPGYKHIPKVECELFGLWP